MVSKANSVAHPPSGLVCPDTADSRLVRACLSQDVDRPPVWFMRQAGRSLPEYRQARVGTSMLEACQIPDLVTEITLQPVRRYDVDAAIFYSDIVVPAKAAGLGVEIVPGTGPVVAEPVRTMADVEALPDLTHEQLGYIDQAVRQIVGELGDKPLIGFAGAPFTVASYLVEGGPSKNHAHTKALMLREPEVWEALLARLADWTATFLETQIMAGASVIQLFDSWVGCLDRQTYERCVQPHSVAVMDRVSALSESIGRRVPRIHFGVGTGELLSSMAQVGVDVVGIDYRMSLTEGAARAAHGGAVQGNLDPAVLFAGSDIIAEQTKRVIADGRQCPGHVFNLGHGVMPETDPDALKQVVDVIKASAS